MKYAKQALLFSALVPAVGFAAPDVTAVVTEIGTLTAPINLIGAAVLGALVLIFGWGMIKRTMGR